jgi:hypothetical protein
MARFFFKHQLFLCRPLLVVSFAVRDLTEFGPRDVAQEQSDFDAELPNGGWPA